MSTSKNIDKICIFSFVLCLLITVVFMNGEALGMQPTSRAMGYENRIFNTDSVHTIDIVMDDWDAFLEECENEEYVACTVVIDGESYKNVALRAKGNTSLSMVSQTGGHRYSFKIEFDHYDSTKTYHGLDKLCLNNLIQDNTMIKDYLVYRMMNEYGVDAPLCSFVYITVNGEDWGLYLAVESIEDAFLQRNYGQNIGDLYKPDSSRMGGGRGNGRDFDLNKFLEQYSELQDFLAEYPEIQEKLTGSRNVNIQELISEYPEMQEFLEAHPDIAESLVNSNDQPPRFPDGEMPPFGNGQPPQFSDGEMPPFGNGQPPQFPDGEMPPFGNGQPPQFPDGEVPPFSNGQVAFNDDSAQSDNAQIPDFPNDNKNNAWGGGRGNSGGGFGGMGMGSDDVKLRYVDDDPDSYSNIFDNAKTNVTDADKMRLIASLKALSENENIDSVVNIDEVLRYFVVHNFVVNGDSYTGNIIHNYYIYEKNGQFSMIPWDYNLSFGGFQSNNPSNAVNDAIDTPLSVGGDDSRPMADWIFASEEYTQLYHAYFSEFLATLDLDTMIDDTSALIAPYVEKDPTKFCTYEEFETAIKALKLFCELRVQSVTGQLVGTIPSTDDGQNADSSTLIDASTLTLSDMGTMGRGGGFGGERQRWRGENRNNNNYNIGGSRPSDSNNTSGAENSITSN